MTQHQYQQQQQQQHVVPIDCAHSSLQPRLQPAVDLYSPCRRLSVYVWYRSAGEVAKWKWSPMSDAPPKLCLCLRYKAKLQLSYICIHWHRLDFFTVCRCSSCSSLEDSGNVYVISISVHCFSVYTVFSAILLCFCHVKGLEVFRLVLWSIWRVNNHC